MARMCEQCSSSQEVEAQPELELEDEGELEFENELEDEVESEAEGWLGTVGNLVGSLLGEQEEEGELEAEGEFEDEFEDEFEARLNPMRKVYADAMMEHLGQLASEAESEEEAVEHFLPLVGMAASKLLPIAAKALAPMAKKLLPRVAKAVTRVTPNLTRGVAKIARGLHRSPSARPMLRAVPGIVRRTVHTIAKNAAKGRIVTPRAAVRTLAHHTKHVLGNPAHRAHALRRHNVIEKRFHRTIGRGLVRPHAPSHHPRHYRTVGGRPVGAVSAHRYHTPGMRTGSSHSNHWPGIASHTGGGPAVGGRRPSTGRIVAGQRVCPACPTCGSAVSSTPTVVAASPNYCRCCGQVLR